MKPSSPKHPLLRPETAQRIFVVLVTAMLFSGCARDDVGITGLETSRGDGVKAIGTDSVTGAFIRTDKDDYVPGDTIRITGGGWAPGETVRLHLVEEPLTHTDSTWDVVADAHGIIAESMYLVEAHHLGVVFTLQATGLTSGSTATAVFTDNRVIQQVELLNPSTNTFVTLANSSPPFVSVGPSTTMTARITGITDGVGPESAWESSQWEIRSGFTTIDSGCDDAISVTSATTSTHTLTFPAPATVANYNLRFRTFASDGCTSPTDAGSDGVSTHSGVLRVVAVPDGRLISAVALFDPATDDFVTIGLDAPPQIVANSGSMTMVRVRGHTGGTGGAGAWQSTQWEIFAGGSTSSLYASGCDNGVNIATATFDVEHTFSIPIPALPGSYSIRFTAFAGANCVSPVGSGTDDFSLHRSALLASGIGTAELLDPQTNTFVALSPTAPPTVTVIGDELATFRVTANSGWTLNPGWQSTRISFPGNPIPAICDNSIDVTTATIGAQHTFTGPVPGLSFDVTTSVVVETFAGPNCFTRIGHRRYDDVLVVRDPNRITLVEIQDPITQAFIPIGTDPPPTVTVGKAAPMTVRITANTGGSSPYWDATAVTVFFDGQPLGGDPDGACRSDINVTTRTIGAQHLITFEAPRFPGTFSLTFRMFAGSHCSTSLGYTYRDQTSHNDVLFVVAVTTIELLDPATNQFVVLNAAAPPTVTASPNEMLTARVTANTDPTIFGSSARGWESTEWQIRNDATSALASAGCESDVTVPPGQLGAQHTFTVQAPGTPGTYSLRFGAFAIDACDNPGLQFLGTALRTGALVVASNAPPTLTGVPSSPQSIPERSPFTFDANATDPDSPPQTLTFSLVGAPSGATIDPTTGVFSWTPSEAQGPGSYPFDVRVSDGSAVRQRSLTLNVTEVNSAPALVIPASFSAGWGTPIPPTQASATDSDLPANGLSFSLVTSPAGMTINSVTGELQWTPTAAQVGANIVRVRVADNGSPSANDEKQFTITILGRQTALTWDGATTGQYSDKAWLSATLLDQTTNTPLSNQTITFTYNGTAAGSATTDANGTARLLRQILNAAGQYAVVASFTAANGYEASSANTTFNVTKENAVIVYGASNAGAIPVSQTSYAINVAVREYAPEIDPSPDPDSRAAPGFISNAGLGARLVGLSTSSNYSVNNCVPTGISGTEPSYGALRNFTCTFTGPFTVDAYTVELTVNGNHYTGVDDDAMTVFDPAAGGVSGGGTFRLDGDRVSFGLSFTYGKGKTAPRGGMVIIRHHGDGSRCRFKSNSLDAPAVTGSTGSYSGKGTYTCVNALGLTTASAGNQTVMGYLEDNGTPGANTDKIWIRAYGEFLMSNVPSAAANAVRLTGGNITVAKP